MCDNCTELLTLFAKYETETKCGQLRCLKKSEVSDLCTYIHTWSQSQRQCTCCYKEQKNFERFNAVLQGALLTVLRTCARLCGLESDWQEIRKHSLSSKCPPPPPPPISLEGVIATETPPIPNKSLQDSSEEENEEWGTEDYERLMAFSSKIFLLNFPLYVAFKHSVHCKLEEVSQDEVSTLGSFCDVNDLEIPIYLLRNVCFFCQRDGLHLFKSCFEETRHGHILPLPLAHAITTVISSLKLWMSIRAIIQHLVPLRSAIVRFLCRVSEADLRVVSNRNMFEYMWTTVKDPLDAQSALDREGLDLAFKYFSSSTLTMRLAGIAQINSHINIYNEICHNESLTETDVMTPGGGKGQQQAGALAKWLIDNRVVEYIFGPNLHVEIIKQSQVILSYLALEGKLTNRHIEAVWAAAQLKHCSRQVLELLPPLIKNLDVGPALYLYRLLQAMEPKEHNEQTLLLASALIKFLWTHGGATGMGLNPLVGHEMTLSLNEPMTNPFGILNKQISYPCVSLSGRKDDDEEEEEEDDDEEEEEGGSSSGTSSSGERSISIEASQEEEAPNNSELESSQVSHRSSGAEDELNSEISPSKSDDAIKDDSSRKRRRPCCSSQRPSSSSYPVHRIVGLSKEDVDDHRISAGSADDEEDEEEDDSESSGQASYLASHCKRKMSASKVRRWRGGRAGRRNDMKGPRYHPTSEESGDDLIHPLSEPSSSVRQVNRKEIKRARIGQKKLTEELVERPSTSLGIEIDEKDATTARGGGGDEEEDKTTRLPPALIKVVFERTQEGDVRDDDGEDEEEDASRFLSGLQDEHHMEASSDPGLSRDEGSCNSSRLSNKSEKNMADFEGEESGCEDELVQLAAAAARQQHAAQQNRLSSGSDIHPDGCLYPRPSSAASLVQRVREQSKLDSQADRDIFQMEDVCEPGQTLLWDLLQDDKILQLGEGLALEAEKILCNLVCWSNPRMIRMKFIEGCLHNLAKNRSVLVSLRILPKLFASFQQFRGNSDTHSVTLWAEKEHQMMKHFFGNLVTYVSRRNDGSPQGMYSHTEEIQVRLHFLSRIFSTSGSPETFRLSRDQVDALWCCLATDPECSDELFSWLLNQARSPDQHALGFELFEHIQSGKMPQLPPESTSMTALALLQQLSSLSRLAMASYDTPSSDADVCGIRQLWGIALKAHSTDVSMSAIQNLNNYYINVHHGTLEKEDEFIQHCMDSLHQASSDLTQAEDSNLTVIQRALLLLKTHMETFHKRYAYHLRRWHLSKEGVSSHRARLVGEKGPNPLKIVCQPAGHSEKRTIELRSVDYVADLRAEVTFWCENRKKNETKSEGEGSSGTSSSKGGIQLSEGPIRMISQGQELTSDLDEKSLGEMGFKDMQLVFVSVGVARPGRRRDSGLEPTSLLPPPPRERLPIVHLLRSTHFERLFELMQHLSSLKAVNRAGLPVVHTKAQVLSRRVWEILMMLPTSPSLLRNLQDIAKVGSGSSSHTTALQITLNPESPQKLMYALQIVEALRHSDQIDSVRTEDTANGEFWSQKFVDHGGLRHLFDIFMSGVLQASEGEMWNEWHQDCLASLLKLLYLFGIKGCQNSQQLKPGKEEDFPDCPDSSRKKSKRIRRGSTDKLLVPKINETMLSMMSDVESVLKVILVILYEASFPTDPNQYRTGFWGRGQVVHCSITLLVSWAFCQPLVKDFLFRYPSLDLWLKRLVLEDPEPAVRREVCTGLYRLCLGTTIDGDTGHPFIAPLLRCLMQFLCVAQNMRPPRPEEEEKEPYGPGCKDYFWLLCRLVDSIEEETLQAEDPDSAVNLSNLAQYLSKAIVSRDYRETRQNTVEDDGLRGILSLANVVVKRDSNFKFSKEGKEFLIEVVDCLFALPCPKQRFLPKCKSNPVRSAAFDLLVELVKGCHQNYCCLHQKLLQQHSPGSHDSPYPWDYWPHEDGRSECGYVGLTNLGATCYLASCMQHLYMMPQARSSILSAITSQESKHESTLCELQRMFAYLLESERKAYNPRSFCKVYTMDHQPLNTGEQKDMAEFFTDLISKLEEMTPQLKDLVKNLFCGMISNNVVSLDCPHISRTLEEFYTLRCQVADMRNLYESLDELTVKDTLEGDNMYTCSQCGKKVRAEKRACINKLPRILCFNTMRYTFNMATMTKEKVNTHFSFPPRLDMAPYMEKNLLPEPHHFDQSEDTNSVDGPQHQWGSNINRTGSQTECFEYELIGVTVHTGTADGGHYYSFIRERQSPGVDKWLLFNDAEVKPFDPAHIAAECFGGEMTSKTYDSVTDKFLDFSFEKTNSAYMLFYEQLSPKELLLVGEASGVSNHNQTTDPIMFPPPPPPQQCPPLQNQTHPEIHHFELSPQLAEWIWQDNMQFLQDRNLFEHTYFNFMWQICGYIPQTLAKDNSEVMLLSAKLGTSFVLETLIHAKEKPTIAQWIELLTKQFNSSQLACEWFLEHMASNDWWPVQILLKCPNQVVRQLFQRLCIHVINQLRPLHAKTYLKESLTDETNPQHSTCITSFIRRLLGLVINMEPGAKQHLTEYFAFLLEFAKMGEEEARFLLSVNAISNIVNFYLGQKATDFDFVVGKVEVASDDEEEDEEESGGGVGIPGGPGSSTGGPEKYKPASLEKMVTLVAILVEKSRDEEGRLRLSSSDMAAIASGKGFPFLCQQIKDNINMRQTCNLIISLCKWNDQLAHLIINMIFSSSTKQPEASGPFFKALSLLVEMSGGSSGVPLSGMPLFAGLILQRIWDTAEYCPQQCLDWLAMQASRSKAVHAWLLQGMDAWVERFLIAHSIQRVRWVAALVLVSLVPSNHFRQAFRSTRSILVPQKEIPHMSSEALMIMHQIFNLLLRLLKRAKLFVEATVHGTTKLMSYFALMTYCLISKTEKLMFSPYFLDLWSLFQPKLSEPAIPVHHNKQALLIFWYQVCVDCSENIKLIVQNPHITKNIAFNYILADHDDQEVVVFNRCMLPAYYGLLKLCCQQSSSFTRQLANHQNIQWAFKNITPYTTQYTAAINELFKLMRLFATKFPDATEQELHEVHHFKCTTLQLYLTVLDARSCWATLVNALRILMETTEDRLFVVCNGGLYSLCQAFHGLHLMYHEATACHVTGDVVELLAMVLDLLKCARGCQGSSEVHQWLLGWKDRAETVHKLLTLLNAYTPPEVRHVCIEVLQELSLLYPENTLALVVPLLANCHAVLQENHSPMPTGPFFPHQGQKVGSKSSLRPQRPMLQMVLHPTQVQAPKGVDQIYDQALLEFFLPYHQFVDMLCRLAVSHNIVTPEIVNLSAMLAIEGVPLHLSIFPKLWLDIYHSEMGHEFLQRLYSSNYLADYMEAVLVDERSSLNNPVINQFFSIFLPKVGSQVVNEQVMQLVLSLVATLVSSQDQQRFNPSLLLPSSRSSTLLPNSQGIGIFRHCRDLEQQAGKLIGDLRALTLIFGVEKPPPLPEEFLKVVRGLAEVELLTSSQQTASTIQSKQTTTTSSASTPEQTEKIGEASTSDKTTTEQLDKPSLDKTEPAVAVAAIKTPPRVTVSPSPLTVQQAIAEPINSGSSSSSSGGNSVETESTNGGVPWAQATKKAAATLWRVIHGRTTASTSSSPPKQQSSG